MNVVGIDVSKGKSHVCILTGELPSLSSEKLTIFHNRESVNHLIKKLKTFPEPVRIGMESTGPYHLNLCDFFYELGYDVYVIPPKLIHDFHPTNLRNPKTDPADSEKIANFILMFSDRLKKYTPEETLRYQLKLANRNRQTTTKVRITLENSVLALTEKVFPGVDNLFTSAVSTKGTLKWVDFLHDFYHVDCVSKLSEEAFDERYKKFCARHHYQYTSFSSSKIYSSAKNLFASMPKDSVTKKLVQNQTRKLKELIKHEKEEDDFLVDLAEQLPEYETVISMNGVGKTLAPQLMAEIGDVRRFPNRKSIVAFAGIDPVLNQSGKFDPNSNRISHTGSSLLRKTLYLVMNSLIMNKPEDDPVYQFLTKKKNEGKPYKICLTAGCNKFLRIYYSKVKNRLLE